MGKVVANILTNGKSETLRIIAQLLESCNP